MKRKTNKKISDVGKTYRKIEQVRKRGLRVMCVLQTCFILYWETIKEKDKKPL